MHYGIEPPHKDDPRRQSVRFFIEERLVELGHVAVFALNALANFYDFSEKNGRQLVKVGIANKRYVVPGLILVAVFIAMVL